MMMKTDDDDDFVNHFSKKRSSIIWVKIYKISHEFLVVSQSIWIGLKIYWAIFFSKQFRSLLLKLLIRCQYIVGTIQTDMGDDQYIKRMKPKLYKTTPVWTKIKQLNR